MLSCCTREVIYELVSLEIPLLKYQVKFQRDDGACDL
jgi:hypothetical protein